MLISIIISTFNRARNLERCLDGISQLTFPAGHAYELIVVDNNSFDDTRSVCERFAAPAPLTFKHLFEPKKGKSRALNRALSAARGDVLFFTDDDCIPRKDLLESLCRHFDVDSKLDVVGGRVELFDKTDLAIAIRLMEERIEFASVNHAFALILGCNMAFQRRVFDAIGRFDPLLGPGTPLVAEDADILYRAFKKGFRVVYSPEIVMLHAHGRKDPAALTATRRTYVLGRGAFYLKHILGLDPAVLRVAYWEAANLLKLAAQEVRKGTFRGDGIHCLWWLLGGAGRYIWQRRPTALSE